MNKKATSITHPLHQFWQLIRNPIAHQQDWLLWGTISLLIAVGIVVNYSSAIYTSEIMRGNEGKINTLFLKNCWMIFCGFILWAVMRFIPYEYWQKNRKILYWLGWLMLLLPFVPGIGVIYNGSYRWISLLGFSFQPSELMKLFYIIFLAGYIDKFAFTTLRHQWHDVLKVVALPVALICILLIYEPDLGSTIFIMFLTLSMTFIASAHLGGFFVLAVAVLIVSTFLILSEGYTLSRWQSFMDPWQDPFNTGYNITQSLMMLGKGDVWGSGLGNSIHKLGYMPEAHGDYVISVIAEELGLIGILCVLIGYLIIIWRLLSLVKACFDKQQIFAGMFVFGIMIWLFFQIFVNIGGAINLLPSKGLVLPFFGQGGSFILVFFSALGIIMQIESKIRGNT